MGICHLRLDGRNMGEGLLNDFYLVKYVDVGSLEAQTRFMNQARKK